MRAWALLLGCACGCAAALKEPPPVGTLARGGPDGRSADELLRAADQAWLRRADPAQARSAEELYLGAAQADESRVDGLIGAIRAKTFLVEREKSGPARAALAVSAVQAGQWCQRRAPQDPACDYWLAVALGQQTRERTATAKDALPRMVALLRKAAAVDPKLDFAGPRRVLAMLLLRAPGWPLGPGDPESALPEAKAALALFPDYPPNQLALAEALARNGHAALAREAYGRAAQLARAAKANDDPDADRWLADALAGLGQKTPHTGSPP